MLQSPFFPTGFTRSRRKRLAFEEILRHGEAVSLQVGTHIELLDFLNDAANIQRS